MKKQPLDFLIVGAGLAGLSTAYFLAGKTRARIGVVEMQAGPGRGASGQNAGMLCQFVRDAVTCRVMLESMHLMRQVWLKELGGRKALGYEACGSLHIGNKADLAGYEAAGGQTGRFGVQLQRLTRDRIVRLCPILAGTRLEGGLWCETDALIDSQKLSLALAAACKSRGVKFWFKEKFDSREWSAGTTIITSAAWSSEVAKTLGAQSIAVKPMLRHIFVTGKIPQRPASLPIVWNVTDEFYFRKWNEGLLLSPCDEEKSAPAIQPPVNPHAEKSLRQKLSTFLPQYRDVRFTRSWSGLRTFSPDRRFVIGWDGKKKDVFWLSCLGGYGLTAAARAGLLAAQLLSQESADPEFTESFSPKRFL